MKIGVFSVLFGNLSFEKMLAKVAGLGFDCVEIGTGAYPGSVHCEVEKLLANKGEARDFVKKVEDAGLFISALSCHGNPIHPNMRIARAHQAAFSRTIQLARQLEVPVVNVLSGCPGDSPKAKCPNWITCAWPPEYPKFLEWQWSEVVIPYWKGAAALAHKHGINKIAVEMHPGFVVYNPETALRLRDQVGPQVGVNFDPSHLFWLGIDIPSAIRMLGAAIFHFHAKDTFVDRRNVAENGILDAKHYREVRRRSWTFRSVGWGHDVACWREIATALRLSGYDYVMSIEHEDPLASADEGLRHALTTLQAATLKEPPSEMWWA
jgi:sugar phosphate isomerase/epimerase